MEEKVKKNFILTIFTWVFIFLLWFLVTEFKVVESSILPSPKQTLYSFINIVKNGYNKIPIWSHLLVSFKRMIVALFFAIITAIPLGLLSGYNDKIKAIVDSIVQFYRPIPPLAYYMLLIVWMGIEDESKITLLFLAAFSPIYLSCVSAVSNIKEDFILNARSLGATNKQIFFNVVFPSALPDIFTGIRNAVGFAYTTLVSAELVAATSGIGWMVIDASRYLKTDVIVVGVVIMGITGIIIDYTLQLLERTFVFWRGK